MNKHLNNFLDKQDGLPENTSNNNIKKELKRQGYKQFRHNSGFIGWSSDNLLEVSDEWENA